MEETLENVGMFDRDESPIMDFGRHRGRSYLDVALNEPVYCNWARQVSDPSAKMEAFLEWLSEHNLESEPADREEETDDFEELCCEGQLMEFGPHKGRTFRDVAVNEPAYCCALQLEEPQSEEVKKFVDWLETFDMDKVEDGEKDVDCSIFEYWIEEEDSASDPESQDVFDEITGVPHADAWDSCSETIGTYGDSVSKREIGDKFKSVEASAECQEFFASWITDDCVVGEKRQREDKHSVDEGVCGKRGRGGVEAVVFALGKDIHASPPDLRME